MLIQSSTISKLDFQSLFKIRESLNLLLQLGTLTVDFSLQCSFFIHQQVLILDLCLQQLYLHLLHFNLLLEILHFLWACIDLNLNFIKFLHNTFYLPRQRLTRVNCLVILIFGIFSNRQLLLDSTLNLVFKLLLNLQHLSLICLHLSLVILLFRIVHRYLFLNFVPDLGVLLHLCRSDILFFG